MSFDRAITPSPICGPARCAVFTGQYPHQVEGSVGLIDASTAKLAEATAAIGDSQKVLGSTTGGLWISDDQGDSWECLSTQLPPIHAVRFSP